MTKRQQAKYKIDRRMGQNIWGRPKSPVNKREYGPGQHGQRRKGKVSDFGTSSAPSRSSRAITAISPRSSSTASTTRLSGGRRLRSNLVGLLERRLDALVYRAKFVPTVFAARQFVNHGHVMVNGRRVTIPSFRFKPGDQVEFKDASKQLALVLRQRTCPSVTCRNMLRSTIRNVGHLRAHPDLTDVPYPVHMEPHLVVEFYSR